MHIYTRKPNWWLNLVAATATLALVALSPQIFSTVSHFLDGAGMSKNVSRNTINRTNPHLPSPALTANDIAEAETTIAQVPTVFLGRVVSIEQECLTSFEYDSHGQNIGVSDYGPTPLLKVSIVRVLKGVRTAKVGQTEYISLWETEPSEFGVHSYHDLSGQLRIFTRRSTPPYPHNQPYMKFVPQNDKSSIGQLFAGKPFNPDFIPIVDYLVSKSTKNARPARSRS